MSPRAPRARRGPLARLAALGTAVVAAVMMLASVVLGREPERPPSCRGTLIPAYVPPGELTALMASGERPEMIVVNPASGPGAARDEAYADAIGEAREAGTTVLGYVHTLYGTREPALVRADVARYAEWYGVDGIFVDETAHHDVHLDYYEALSAQLRAQGLLVALNPGVVPARGYFDVADLVVTFEGTPATYEAALDQMPDWVLEEPEAKIAHILYGASRAQALAAIALGGHAGFVYATSGTLPNPWGTLPDYLEETERALRPCADGSLPARDAARVGAAA